MLPGRPQGAASFASSPFENAHFEVLYVCACACVCARLARTAAVKILFCSSTFCSRLEHCV